MKTEQKLTQNELYRELWYEKNGKEWQGNDATRATVSPSNLFKMENNQNYTYIIPLLGQCIATWYAKANGVRNQLGRGDTVT